MNKKPEKKLINFAGLKARTDRIIFCPPMKPGSPAHLEELQRISVQPLFGDEQLVSQNDEAGNS